MTSPPSQLPSSHKLRNIPLIIIAALMIVLCAFICGISVSASFLIPQYTSDTQSNIYPTPDGWITLSAADDGCHVERTDMLGTSPVRTLTWVISDMDGYVLLERNAEGEYKYGYYRSGNYRVHLKGWYEGRYHPLSDEVLINCP